jgi:hypothetical protein
MDLEELFWKMIDPSIRVDLLSVAEGVKKGAMLELWRLDFDYNKTQIALQEFLLHTWLNGTDLSHREHESLIYVCRSESLMDKLWSREIDTDDFLGYPKCCVCAHREHSEKIEQYFNDEISLEDLPLAQGYVLGGQILGSKGNYNPALNYVLHMPCSISCEDTIVFAEKIRDCLEKNDLEAAEWLRDFNEDSWKNWGHEGAEGWYEFISERKKKMYT